MIECSERLRHCLALIAIGAVMHSGSTARAAEDAGTVAVADFDYVDTSGEIQDQTSDHGRRLDEFASMLRAEIGRGSLRATAIGCSAKPCSAEALDPDRLLAAAKALDSRYLVYGGVHKTSTLVEWMKVDMIDLRTKKLLASKLVTFRGDTDEAYRRAAIFVARDILLPSLR